MINDCHYPVTFDDNFDACVRTICNYKVMICRCYTRVNSDALLVVELRLPELMDLV